LGEKGYTWFDVPEKIDIANLFRSLWKEVVDQATRLPGGLSVSHVLPAGMFPGMNRCIF
jgi:hypothetical protein